MGGVCTSFSLYGIGKRYSGKLWGRKRAKVTLFETFAFGNSKRRDAAEL